MCSCFYCPLLFAINKPCFCKEMFIGFMAHFIGKLLNIKRASAQR